MVFNSLNSWYVGEKLTHTDFNEQVDQNLDWLHKRNISQVTVRNGVSDFSAVVNTSAIIMPTILYTDITTNGGDLLITANLSMANAGVSGYNYIHPIARRHGDDDYFFLVSQGRTVPSVAGFTRVRGSGYVARMTLRFHWSGVEPATYRVGLFWHVTIGTATINLTNTVNQLTVEEYAKAEPS